MTPLALLALAYLAGSIPSSLWVGRAFFGVDLRVAGSGNLGATNAFRVLGWPSGLFVLVFDVAKGWAPVAVFPAAAGLEPGRWALAFGAAAILGHMFSIWARFRGGKGVATSAGVLLALAPGPLGAAAIIWIAVLAITRTVSVASVLAAVALPIALMLLDPGAAAPPGTLEFAFGVSVFVVWAHRSNIRRVMAGTEPRLGRDDSEGAG